MQRVTAETVRKQTGLIERCSQLYSITLHQCMHAGVKSVHRPANGIIIESDVPAKMIIVRWLSSPKEIKRAQLIVIKRAIKH